MNAVIDASVQDEVRPVLEPGECLLWAGRPDPLRSARTKIGQAIFGTVFVLIFSLAYLSCLPAGKPYFGANSVPFSLSPAILAAGSLLTFSGMLLPVLAYRKALTTVYAVTDRRVLSLARGRSAKEVRYDDMRVPLLDLRSNGSGDIYFNGKFRADGTEHHPQFPRFLGVGEAESVHQLVLGLMQGAADGQTAHRAVQDYLELLLQGKRTLDEDQTWK